MHVAVDDFYDEIKTCSQHRVIRKVQTWKIFFMLLEESVFSGFSLLYFRGTKVSNLSFLFISFFPRKDFDILYLLVLEKQGSFFP